MNKSIYRLSLLLTALVATLAISCSTVKKIVNPSGNKSYKLTFADEFNGEKLNPAVWKYRTDSKHWSSQLPENVLVSNGMLKLLVKKEKVNDKEYTGAGIISSEEFGFGYYEARFKIPRGSGWHNSFWLMKYDGSGGTGPSVSALELDICENDSRGQLGYQVNLHRWRGEHIQRGTKHVPTPKLSEGYHTWGCEYSDMEVKYYFDGKLVQAINVKDLPHSPVNIWLTTIASFLGKTAKVDDDLLPDAMQVDYVRYYKAK